MMLNNITKNISKSTTNVARRTFASQPSLDVEMEGMPILSPGTGTKPNAKVTTLKNGLRVASAESISNGVSALGVFVDAGSKFENFENNGTSHMLERMAFKSTEKRSSLRLVRDIEDIGGQFGAFSAREFMIYQGECLRESVDDAVEILAETTQKPELADWDIDEQRKIIGFELEDMESSAQAILTEVIHAAAYTEQSGLGQPLWCPKRNLDKLNATHLRNYVDTHFTAGRMVLSACGVDHDKLVALAEKHFGDLPTSPINGVEPVAQSTKYVGGDRRIVAESDFTHVTIGFDAGGWNAPDLLEKCTLQMLLGGGGSFSAGGPGKGMYSRLYTNVLNKNWVDSATAFNSMYNDGGILGIYGTSYPEAAGQLVDVMCHEIESVAKTAPNKEETERAKNALKSALLVKLESRVVTFEDMGRQLLTFGKHEEASDLVKKVDAITPEGIQKAAQSLLKSKLTMASFGNVERIPDYDQVASRFN